LKLLNQNTLQTKFNLLFVLKLPFETKPANPYMTYCRKYDPEFI